VIVNDGSIEKLLAEADAVLASIRDSIESEEGEDDDV
jgi:hypothetical protein